MSLKKGSAPDYLNLAVRLRRMGNVLASLNFAYRRTPAKQGFNRASPAE